MPSSPKGPCRRGRTTTGGSSAVGAPAVSDRQRVEARAVDRQGVGQGVGALGQGGHGRLGPLPAAVTADADGDHLVAGGVHGPQHVGGGDPGDVVLGGAAPEEHHEPGSGGAHGQPRYPLPLRRPVMGRPAGPVAALTRDGPRRPRLRRGPPPAWARQPGVRCSGRCAHADLHEDVAWSQAQLADLPDSSTMSPCWIQFCLAESYRAISEPSIGVGVLVAVHVELDAGDQVRVGHVHGADRQDQVRAVEAAVELAGDLQRLPERPGVVEARAGSCRTPCSRSRPWRAARGPTRSRGCCPRPRRCRRCCRRRRSTSRSTRSRRRRPCPCPRTRRPCTAGW